MLAPLAAGSLVLGAAPAGAQALPDVPGCERASEEAPLLVEVTTLAPRAPQRADQPFQVSGRLVNCGREPLRGVEVRLGVGERLDTRARVARADEEPVVGRRVLVRDDDLALPSGASRPFDLRLLTGELGLGRRNGVFPLTVQGRARVGEESQRGQVGLAHTFVPWFPDTPIAPTRVAWVLPLVDAPHRGPGEVMLDDELDARLEDDVDDRGRLQRALLSGTEGARGACDPTAAPPEGTPRDPSAGCRGEPVPMTYALDPDLLYSVEAMARPGGYRVLEDGEPVDRDPSQNAEQWLVALRAAATSGSDVLALPYGDPDVVALTRTSSPVPDDVQTLRRLGGAETRRLLGAEPLTSVAWLPPGPVGGSVDALAGGEVRTLVVDAAALPAPSVEAPFTPSARTTLASTAGAIDALVVDDGLTRLLEPDPSSATWQGARLAEQRWIAEAAALTAERPSVSRTIVVAPPRDADLLASLTIGAITDTGRLPFLCPVSLRSAAAGTERCAPGGVFDDQDPAEAAPRGAPLPPTDGDRELDPEVVRALGEVRAASDQFTDQVLLAGSEQAKAAKARLLRARG
ncbi:MAG: putative rane protein, partial [Frankiales bacterium]|nr:putative rane protein [Frankiales bacterium]